MTIKPILALRIGDLVDLEASLGPTIDGHRFRQVRPIVDTNKQIKKWYQDEALAEKIYPGTRDEAVGLVVDYIEEDNSWVILLGTKYLKIANSFTQLYLVKNRINQPKNMVP